MTDGEFLASRFEAHRAHLGDVAYRMLGTRLDADDAVQEAWLRLGRTGVDEVRNLRGWLTSGVARVCLALRRARTARREDSIAASDLLGRHPADNPDGEAEAASADSVGRALLIVLETMPPAERVAYVLHDLFELPFEEIAPIVERSPGAARQLASRGRRRVRQGPAAPGEDPSRQHALVEAFLAASRAGDFAGLVALLDPAVVLRADAAAVAMGATAEVRGVDAVAETFQGRARAAQPATVDGAPGLVWMAGGLPRVVFRFSVASERINGIELLADLTEVESVVTR